MRIETSIQEKLRETFQPLHLEVVNESGNHNVPAGSESHFKVIVVSTQFEGLSQVQRHRLVNKALAFELANGVHALAMKLMSDREWEAANHSHGHSSPQCMHR